MSAALWFTILAILALIMLSAFFSGSETALTAASRARMYQLAKSGNKRASLVEKLTAEKERLIGEYELEMGQLNGNPSAITSAGPDTLERLKDATSHFREVMEEHRRLVQSAKSVSDRMLKTITEEVSQRQRPVTGYTAKAEMRTPFSRTQTPVSLALNQVV